MIFLYDYQLHVFQLQIVFFILFCILNRFHFAAADSDYIYTRLLIVFLCLYAYMSIRKYYN